MQNKSTKTTDLAPQLSVKRALASLVDASGNRQWLSFTNPVATITAWQLDHVRSALQQVESMVEGGLWAVGVVSYGAAPAFDPALVTRSSSEQPLLAFGLFANADPDPGDDGSEFTASGWNPTVDQQTYEANVRDIKHHIARGDTYQVNLTHQLQGHFTGDPLALFRSMTRSQGADHCVYLDMGNVAMCSASPELFFTYRPSNGAATISSKPMKGTRPRDDDPNTDRRLLHDLATSPKDRAENTMIVDMMRNDFGRIAKIGTVSVPTIHAIESYPTVHQMTSTVTATTGANVTEIFDACFPAASITGAPKVRTTELIAELEPEPRGVYCGAAGVMSPDGPAEFNVAIRTAWVDRLARTATYGVGGGIIWDSDPTAEWEETQVKARVLQSAPGQFDLIETMRFSPTTGIFLLHRHMDRLANSARRFGFVCDIHAIGRHLRTLTFATLRRIRLALHSDGSFSVTTEEFKESAVTWDVPIDVHPTHPDPVFRGHKTTIRDVFREARARHPGALDVILRNSNDEVTETTIGNIVILAEGKFLTPPLTSGLLPGVFRSELLNQKRIVEHAMSVDDLRHADEVWMINALRGWTRLTIAN